jgi:hypothetical protein
VLAECCGAGTLRIAEKRSRRTLFDVQRPDTNDVKSRDVHIAYQVTGDGPLDLVWPAFLGGHLEFEWNLPGFQARSSRGHRDGPALDFSRT